jgi:hypothetical protein
MRHRKASIVVIALALLAGASALWVLSDHSQTNSVSVSFVTYTTDGSGRRMAQFRYSNQNRVGIVSPDDCLTEIRGVKPGMLTRLNDIRLKPGEAEMILLPPPDSQSAWRIRIGHYPEDWSTNLKISIAHRCKRLNIPKSFLPLQLRTIRNHYVWSDWVTE